MTKIVFLLVVAGIAYGFYSGWFDMGRLRGDTQAAAWAKQRLAEAREFVAANCR